MIEKLAKKKLEEELKNPEKLKKKVVRTVVIKGFLSILPLLIIFALVVSMFSILQEIGSKIKDTIVGVWQNIVNLFKKNQEIPDELVLQFIEDMEEYANVNFNDLKLSGDIDYDDEENQETILEDKIKYVRQFLESQLISQEANRPVSKLLQKAKVLPKYVAKGDEQSNIPEAQRMVYVTPEKFYAEMEKETKKDCSNWFTINEETGNIIYCTYTETKVSTKAGTDTEAKGGDPVRIYHAQEEFDYKSFISKYSTPAQFFIYLGEIVQNPNFLSAFADLITEAEKDKASGTYTTQIDFTLFETITHTTKTDVETYYENKYVGDEEVPVDADGDGETDLDENGNPIVNKVPKYEKTGPYTETTITDKWETNLVPAVTYANTWMMEETYRYEYEEGEPSTEGPTTPEKLEDETGDPSRVDRTMTTTTTKVISTYKGRGLENSVYKAGEEPDEHPEYTSFVDLLDEEFEIPHSSRKEAPGYKFRDGADWFLMLIAQDPQTSGKEVFMKYVLNRYTHGQLYGEVTWNDVVANGIYSDYMIDVGSNGGSSGGGNSGSGGSGGSSGGSGTTTSGNDVDVHDSSLFVTDVNKIKEAIDKCFRGGQHDNLYNNINAFMDMQSRYGVNAIYAMAKCKWENGCRY